ncbi:MAG: hypothetical protein JWQ35_131 [Bacteriovoracaceae bacterium]|nr:hypothetical protein [Bacteriovoracaceae bacterium]
MNHRKIYSVLIGLSASIVVIGNFQTQAQNFYAYPNSMLAKYEKAEQELEALYGKPGERAKAVEILNKFYGFTEVKFAGIGKNDRETRMAVFMAENLKRILPANISESAYIGVDRREIHAGSSQEQEPTDKSRNIIITFDKSAGVDFKFQVADKKMKDPNGETIRERVETYRLNVGGTRTLLSTEDLKAWMATIINYNDSYYKLNYDVPPDVSEGVSDLLRKIELLGKGDTVTVTRKDGSEKTVYEVYKKTDIDSLKKSDSKELIPPEK